MQALLNHRVLSPSCPTDAFGLTATINPRTFNARSRLVRAELAAGASTTQTSSALAPAKPAFGPRVQTGCAIPPFEKD